MIYGVPGMKALADHLGKVIDKSSIKKLKEIWKKHHNDISINGLEVGFAGLTQTENILVDVITGNASQLGCRRMCCCGRCNYVAIKEYS